MAAQINVASRNAQLTAFGTRYAAATLTIYSGTMPSTVDDSLSGNTALAVHTLAGFAAAASASMAASAIADVAMAATGTATFARLVAGAETAQMTVGTSGADIIVDSTAYIAGNTSKINSLTVTQARNVT
ncbi:MAG: hypothetical protein U5M23_01305 [Marinagarivorans sp.]|nr:hypothetical protein [Marinagarivorans sp.]